MKELQGKEVYLIPTGNYARRMKFQSEGFPGYLKATVIKVARVNITLKIDNGYKYEEEFRYEDTSLSTGHNAGYNLYKSLQELEDHLLSQKIAQTIFSEYRYNRDWQEVGADNLKKIAEILGLEVGE